MKVYLIFASDEDCRHFIEVMKKSSPKDVVIDLRSPVWHNFAINIIFPGQKISSWDLTYLLHVAKMKKSSVKYWSVSI